MTATKITEIVQRDPPHAAPKRPSPSTPLDDAILEFLSDGVPRELQEITRTVGGTTHRVHARAQSLVRKGLVDWIKTPGGPARGPGTSTYRIARGV